MKRRNQNDQQPGAIKLDELLTARNSVRTRKGAYRKLLPDVRISIELITHSHRVACPILASSATDESPAGPVVETLEGKIVPANTRVRLDSVACMCGAYHGLARIPADWSR